jgi:orotidine-5'-phosphate decarboxylase
MVIVALDFTSKQEVDTFLTAFKEPIYVKIGMSLYYALGPDIIKDIKSKGHKIFLDLKLHDIPHQVSEAMKGIAHLGVDMVNVHAKGGIKMMREARKSLDGVANPPILLAVTELTSTDQVMMNKELGTPGSMLASVLRLAKNAKTAGCDGVVCSALESLDIKAVCGSQFLTVTPGIRYQASGDDQVRVVTPKFAQENQADYIVVGRPITASSDKLGMYNVINSEFKGV